MHDRVTGETRHVSVASNGNQGNGFSVSPAFSADKRSVAFSSISDNLAAWAGVASANNESAGKRYSGKTHRGNKALNTALIQAARAATHTLDIYLSAQYHRLAGRRSKKRVIVAVAHSILVIAYHLIKRKKSYHEQGGDYFVKRWPEATPKRLLKRLELLGYDISQINQPAVLHTPA